MDVGALRTIKQRSSSSQSGLGRTTQGGSMLKRIKFGEHRFNSQWLTAVWGALVTFLLGERKPTIRGWMEKSLEVKRLGEFTCFPKNFPPYRFVDLFYACNRLCLERGGDYCDADYSFRLNHLLDPTVLQQENCPINLPPKRGFSINVDEEDFLSTDRFWAIGASDSTPALIIRLNYVEQCGVFFEVASTDSTYAEETIESILDDAKENSIYRGKLLEISFEAKVDPRYGGVVDNGINLKFVTDPKVTSKEIIVDPEVESILKRNVFDFHEKREVLRNLGLPNKKGLLFYGPPGTGKTFTCKYVYCGLKDVTCLVVSGKVLTQVQPVCEIARLLQPALVVLEDVDLVFKSREINLYSSVLGDLMDELDGFQSDDAVTFLLTTNAIERMEAAIKDRPGRISQCVYFGPPRFDAPAPVSTTVRRGLQLVGT